MSECHEWKVRNRMQLFLSMKLQGGLKEILEKEWNEIYMGIEFL